MGEFVFLLIMMLIFLVLRMITEALDSFSDRKKKQEKKKAYRQEIMSRPWAGYYTKKSSDYTYQWLIGKDSKHHGE